MRNLDAHALGLRTDPHFAWTKTGKMRRLTKKEKKELNERLNKAEILNKAIKILCDTGREDFKELAYELRVATDVITRR